MSVRPEQVAVSAPMSVNAAMPTMTGSPASETKVGVRQIRRGHERLDPRICDVDKPPGEIQRDGHRADDDEAGEEVVAHARAEVPAAAGRILATSRRNPARSSEDASLGPFVVGWLIERPWWVPCGTRARRPSWRTFPRISAGRKGAALPITAYRLCKAVRSRS